MTMIFDGKKVALEKEGELKRIVSRLRKKGIGPRAVSILVGNDKASNKYLILKKKAAERVGAKIEIIKLQTRDHVSQVTGLIKKLNKDGNVHGIMVQLPLPSGFSRKDRDEIVYTIKKGKDIDGMRDDSQYLAPVVKSVLKSLKYATDYTINNRKVKVVVIGAKGFVGSKILSVMKNMDYKTEGVDVEVKNLSGVTKNADILISATGVAGLIKKHMVKRGAVVIDVGSPGGDVVVEDVLKKAKYISPVPGGVGPLTINYLLENLLEAASERG